MAFLFLVVLVLVIWVARLQSRMTDLDARLRERDIQLESLRDWVLNPPAAAPAPPRAVPPPIPVTASAPPAARPAVAPPKAAAAPAPAVRATTDAPVEPTAITGPASSAKPLPPANVPGPTPPAPKAARVDRPPVPPAAPAAPGFDWEELIGVRLFSWVAGIALAVAAVFFLGYSIQQGWLQPPVRMAIGLAVGVGLLVGCEFKAARRYPVTANALDGAAIVILFSTFFSSYRLWGLIGPLAAFAVLALVTLAAVLLSIRRDSVFIALLGLVGGFSTPALLSTGQDNPFGLFGYLLLLNAGLGWVAYRKRWPVLVALSLVVTTVYQWSWVSAFLTPSKLPTAAAVFLAFPVLAFASLAFAGRAGALDEGGEPVDGLAGRKAWFDQAAGLNAALPLLFALFMASSGVYGEHPGVLFGFLFCVDAGLFAIAIWRRQPLLHLLGAAATLVVFAAWMNGPAGDDLVSGSGRYPVSLAFATAFVLFYLAAGLAARHGSRRLAGPGRLAVYTAPLLLFVFPVSAFVEPAAASPALLFGVLFGLLAACAAFAMAEREGLVYFIAAFLAVATEVSWSSAWLDADRLWPAIAIYLVFGVSFVAWPLAARRVNRPLQPAWCGGWLTVGSVALLLFLTQGGIAARALWGLGALLALLNVALQIDAKAEGRLSPVVAGTVVSWLVIASWWLGGGAVTDHLLGALALVAGYAMLTVLGRLWAVDRPGESAGDGTTAALSLSLVAHLFLLAVAAEPSLSVPPWPMLAALAVIDLVIGAAALIVRRAEFHAVSLGLSQVVLIAAGASARVAPYPLVAMLASLAVSSFGLVLSELSRRRVDDERARAWFHVAPVVALVLGQALLIALAFTPGAPGAFVLAPLHVVVVTGLLVLAWRTGWLDLSVAAAVMAGLATAVWQWLHPGADRWVDALVLSTPLYAAFVAFPVVMGRRVGRSLAPHMAAIVASGTYFVVARSSLVAGGYEAVIGVLPVVQAAVMTGVLAALLRAEPPSERAVGRLALVAAAALAFVTVAIPLQLERHWITIGWALEGTALAWLFGRLRHRGLLAWSLVLFAIVFARLALNPGVLVSPRSGTPILNWYLYTYLTAAASMLVASWLLGGTADVVLPPLRGGQVLAAGGAMLLFVLLNVEIADFYATGPTLTFRLSAGLAQNLTYTLGWAAFAVCLLAAGIALRSHAARLAAIVLLTVTMLKGFLSDVARLGGLYRVMSFVGLAICLSLVAVVLQRFVLAPKSGDRES